MEYDPINFLSKFQILTLAIVGSFFSIKLLNSLYENLYEPIINNIIDYSKTDKYYLKIGKHYIKIDNIIKQFIEWIFFILIIITFYNIYIHIKKN